MNNRKTLIELRLGDTLYIPVLNPSHEKYGKIIESKVYYLRQYTSGKIGVNNANIYYPSDDTMSENNFTTHEEAKEALAKFFNNKIAELNVTITAATSKINEYNTLWENLN